MENIIESTKRRYELGNINLHGAAKILYEAGFGNFVDEKKTLDLFYIKRLQNSKVNNLK